MEEKRGVCRVFVGKPAERGYLGEPGLDARIILKWFSRKWDVGVRIGSSRLRIGTVGGHL